MSNEGSSDDNNPQGSSAPQGPLVSQDTTTHERGDQSDVNLRISEGRIAKKRPMEFNDEIDGELADAITSKRAAMVNHDNLRFTSTDGPYKSHSPSDPYEKPKEATGISSGDLMFKVLSPDLGVGAIIGKSGSVIHEINDSTGARIKISQPNEYYPETTDRVISITGTAAAIDAAIGQVISRVIEVCISFVLR